MRDMIKKMCCLGICFLLFFGSGCKEKETFQLEEIVTEDGSVKEEKKKSEKSNEEAVEKDSKEEHSDRILYVYVCGEVKQPGVYELLSGSRVYAAIQAAGGMTGKADPNCLNQAACLEDGQQIYVQSKEEAEAVNHSSGVLQKSKEEAGKINLNTAQKEELLSLPGIGEAKAESIIRYREENGEFKKLEDLMKIEGIKSGVFQKIKEHVTI